MKKVIFIALAAFLCLGMMAGCAAQTDNTPNATLQFTQTSLQENVRSSTDPTSDFSAAYDKFVSYKTEGYSKESVVDFNRSFLPENGDLSELLAAYADVTATISSDDKNYDFIMGTLAASINELYCEQMNDKSGFSSSVKKQARPIETLEGEEKPLPEEQAYEFVFNAFYSVQYTITDPIALTVADRDAALQAFRTEFQNYINGLSETELMSGNIKKTLSSKASELANDLSSDTLELSCEISGIEIHNVGTEVQY